jgi:hypothetical protein
MGRMLGDQQSVEDALKIMGGSDSSGASSFKTTKQRPLVLQVMITGA